MIKVLFVCLGNICRSPMAEFVLKDMVKKKNQEMDFYIESAATSSEEIGNDVHRGTKRKLMEEGIEFTHRGARKITLADYEKFDYFLRIFSDYPRYLFYIRILFCSTDSCGRSDYQLE